MANPTVKLTFAGDASGLDRASMQARTAMVQTGESAKNLEHNLEQTGRAAKGTKELLRGASDASMLLGGSLGNTAVQAGLAVGAMKDISRGAAALLKNVGLLRLGVIGLAIVGFGTLIDKLEPQPTVMGKVKGALADMGYALATDLHFVTQGVPILGRFTGKLEGVADGASKAARQLNFFSDAEEKALRAAHEASLFQAPDTNPGGDAIFTAADAAEINRQVYESETPGYKERTLAESGLFDKKKASSAGSGISAAAQAIKDAAKQLADAKKSVADAVRGIADSFKPVLDLSGGTDGFSRVGLTQGGAKGGLIANLKKQADDTLKLRKDLEKLAKMGLDPGLLTTLVAGGLASLPAAEDLLKGGRSEIGQANYYAGKINLRSNTIATEQTARALTKKDKQTLDINVKGGDAELVKLIRKWVHGNGGNVQSVLGG